MEIRGATDKAIILAAMRAKVRVDNHHGGSDMGYHNYRGHESGLNHFGHTRDGKPKYRLVLRTSKDKKGNVIWGRRGFRILKDGSRCRVPGAVCWHGHRAFMRELYRIVPDAVIITGLARYNGADHFEQTHTMTAYHNIGSEYRPLMVADACDCNN